MASATRLAWGPLSLEPSVRFRFGDDGEDLDGVFLDVIEHPYLVDTQAVLRPVQPAFGNVGRRYARTAFVRDLEPLVDESRPSSSCASVIESGGLVKNVFQRTKV